MQFSAVIGQQEIIHRLCDMAQHQRVPNTLMLCGPAGCGKMAVALAFASYLLGERNEGKSLLTDEASIRNAEAMLHQYSHPDLHFSFPVIKPSGASSDHKAVSDDFIGEWKTMLSASPYFTLETWLTAMGAANQQALIGAGESDVLAKKLLLKSSQGGYKVSIIWLPERMNVECANKLLKLLEEPPHQTVFILVCEEPELLLDTIKSRAQRIDMKRINDADMAAALVERRALLPEDAQRIARIANGNWLKALESLDVNSENVQFLDMFKMLMRLAYQRNVKELKRWSEIVATYGREKQRRLLDYCLRLVRENFMYNFGEPSLCYMTREEEEFSQKFARFINETNVIPISELLQTARQDIGQNANAKIVFFELALQMIVLLIKK
jgi:DNA polymerase III, gamma/tau subunit